MDVDLSRTVVLIPVLNEEDSIGLVLAALPTVMEVIVCDNGSTDRSADIAKQNQATVLLENKRGYGAACLRGLRYLEEKLPNEQPEIVVFMDGDFSDHPEEIVSLVNEIQNRNFEFVVGSRMIGNREKRRNASSGHLWKLACLLFDAFVLGGQTIPISVRFEQFVYGRALPIGYARCEFRLDDRNANQSNGKETASNGDSRIVSVPNRAKQNQRYGCGIDSSWL